MQERTATLIILTLEASLLASATHVAVILHREEFVCTPFAALNRPVDLFRRMDPLQVRFFVRPASSRGRVVVDRARPILRIKDLIDVLVVLRRRGRVRLGVSSARSGHGRTGKCEDRSFQCESIVR